MTARKRPSAAEPAKAKRGGRSQVEPTPSEAKRKITLYFRVGLLEEARSAVLFRNQQVSGSSPAVGSTIPNGSLQGAEEDALVPASCGRTPTEGDDAKRRRPVSPARDRS